MNSPFAEWYARLVVRHPLLASAVQPLPGVTLAELFEGVAAEAWEASAARAGVEEAPEVDGAAEQAPAAQEGPAEPRRTGRGRSPRRNSWTPERRAQMADLIRQRHADGKMRQGRPGPRRVE